MLSIFEISDNKVLTKHDLDGINSLTPKEYLDKFLQDNQYLAIPSNSGGAVGGSGSQANAGENGAVPTEDYIGNLGFSS